MCHCTEDKLLGYRRKIHPTLNATIQQFVTAKLSGCALKQGSTTHSSITTHSTVQNTQLCILVFCNSAYFL